MSAPDINFWREIRRSIVALPLVFVAIGAATCVLIFAGLALAIIIVSPSSVTSDQQQKAQAAVNAPAGPMQVIVAIARCLSGAECPTSSASHDITSVVAATSTINGQTLTPKDGEGWRTWADVFNQNGLIQQDSVVALSPQGQTQALQVTNDAGETLVCQAEWDSHKKLVSWQCAASTATAPTTKTPIPTSDPSPGR